MQLYNAQLLISTVSKQEAQLPQRNSASVAHMEGARPSSPLPLHSLWLHLCMRMVESETRNKRTSSVPSTKMNRAFKVIQGHPYWCRQESRTVCYRKVQLMPTLFQLNQSNRFQHTADDISTVSKVNKKAEQSQRRPRDAPNIWLP